jgi:malonate transporter and related proteins
MVMLIAKALLPVYVGLGLGYFAGRRRLVDNVDVRSLNSLLMQFALPFSLFLAIAQTPRAEILVDGRFAAVMVLTMVLTYAPMFWLSRRAFKVDGGAAAVHALTVGFPNVAGVGLSVLVSAFGPKAALPVAIGIAAGAISISPLTLALLELAKVGEASPHHPLVTFLQALGRSLRRPIFVGPALGVLVSALGFAPPPLLATSLGPLTACTAGVGLFLTGLMLSAQAIRLDGKVGLSVLIANVLQPLLALGLAMVFALTPLQRAEAVVLATLPCGFFGLVFGAGFGARPAVAGSSLVFSSILSALTLAVVLSLSL